EGQLRTRQEEQRRIEENAGGPEAAARLLALSFKRQHLATTERELLQTQSRLRDARSELELQKERERSISDVVTGRTHLQVLAAQTVTSPTTPSLASATTQLLTIKRFQDAFALDVAVDAEVEKHPTVLNLVAEVRFWQAKIDDTRSKARNPDHPKVQEL